MRGIVGGVQISQSDVLQLQLSSVCGRYVRGNLRITVYTILDGSDDVLVSCPKRPDNDFSPFEWWRCSGWALAEYVIDGMFTLDVPKPLPVSVLLTEDQQRSLPVVFRYSVASKDPSR